MRAPSNDSHVSLFGVQTAGAETMRALAACPTLVALLLSRTLTTAVASLGSLAVLQRCARLKWLSFRKVCACATLALCSFDLASL